jgi:hypothetical protein
MTVRERGSVRRPGRTALAGAVGLSLLLVGACAGGGGPAGTSATQRPGLPSDTGFDYQLGGAYTPPDGVGVVVRDRSERPMEHGYSICYVNAFQTQPDDEADWDEDLLLHVDGAPVTDPDWPDETLLDTSTDPKRQRIVDVVRPWIRDCAERGYQAVEFDNLDSYTRSESALDLDDNTALASSLVALAHRDGLDAAQKNLAEHALTLKDSAGFDLAIAEECAANGECGDYTRAYGEAMVDIEYTDHLSHSFDQMCGQADRPRVMILRDRDLVTPKSKGYVYRACS